MLDNGPDWRRDVPTLRPSQLCPDHPDQPPPPACRRCPHTPSERAAAGADQARQILREAAGPRRSVTECLEHGSDSPADQFGRCLTCRPVRQRTIEEIEAADRAAVAEYHALRKAQLREMVNPPGYRRTPDGAVVSNAKPEPEQLPPLGVQAWRSPEDAREDARKIVNEVEGYLPFGEG